MSARLVHHSTLLLSSCLSVALLYFTIPLDYAIVKLSISTGATSLLLLAATLLIGPVNVIRGRPPIVSSYLRRDTAIWAGILAILHTIVGLQVHFNGEILHYFFNIPASNIVSSIRFDWFGLTNYLGLFSTLIIGYLLWLSNDASIKRYGARQWKNRQRIAYVMTLFIVIHTLIYQLSLIHI